jgi:hypothetical protein
MESSRSREAGQPQLDSCWLLQLSYLILSFPQLEEASLDLPPTPNPLALATVQSELPSAAARSDALPPALPVGSGGGEVPVSLVV